MSSALAPSKFLTLSFSGAGHLLPYHLGVACAIKSDQSPVGNKIGKPIKAVSGSSSGAIAAAVFVCFDKQYVREYAARFITDGGRALHHFKEMMPYATGEERTALGASLHIAATRCSDGASRLFDFPHGHYHPDLPSVPDEALLVKCLEASCKIPPHFHPADVISSRWPSTYPEDDGVSIEGCSYVDGGIAAPAPPTPMDSWEGACRVVVSPISGSNDGKSIRISPTDTSWKLPFGIKCRGGFAVNASVQNLQAMQVSAGLASQPILQEWFDRGIKDGERIRETG